MLPVLFCCPPPSPNIRHQPQLQRGCGLHELFLPVTLTALQAGAVSGLSRCFGVRMEFFPNLAVWRLLLSLVRPPEHSQHSSTRRSLALSCFLPSLRCSSELFHLCSRSLLFGWGTLAGIFSLCLVSLEETISSGKSQQGLQLGFPLNLQEFVLLARAHLTGTVVSSSCTGFLPVEAPKKANTRVLTQLRGPRAPGSRLHFQNPALLRDVPACQPSPGHAGAAPECPEALPLLCSSRCLRSPPALCVCC